MDVLNITPPIGQKLTEISLSFGDFPIVGGDMLNYLRSEEWRKWSLIGYLLFAVFGILYSGAVVSLSTSITRPDERYMSIDQRPDTFGQLIINCPPTGSFFCEVHEFLLTDYFYQLTYAIYFMSGLAGIILWFMI